MKIEVTVPPTAAEVELAYTHYLWNRPSFSHVCLAAGPPQQFPSDPLKEGRTAHPTEFSPPPDRKFVVDAGDEFSGAEQKDIEGILKQRYPGCLVEIVEAP